MLRKIPDLLSELQVHVESIDMANGMSWIHVQFSPCFVIISCIFHKISCFISQFAIDF
jgi:hypothetical protein